MATIDLLAVLKRGGLSKKQRDELKGRLRQRRIELEKAITAVERALEALGEKPKRKKTAKRRGARRAKR
jgi:ferritin-like metal-binding protein YciE